MPSLPKTPAGRDRPPTVISPSLLSSDFSKLAEESRDIIKKGADWLHVDVMDGVFVDNITLGAPVVKSLHAAIPDAFLDCHLMVRDPARWVPDFAAAGASMFTFHFESVAEVTLGQAAGRWDGGWATPADEGAAFGEKDVHRAVSDLIDKIHEAGMLAGITIRPATQVQQLERHLDRLDMVLIMTVNPGFGGQSFMPSTMDKVAWLRSRKSDLWIEVDGGLSPATIDQAAKAGANAIVAGSAVFGASDPQAAIETLRRAVDDAAALGGGAGSSF